LEEIIKIILRNLTVQRMFLSLLLAGFLYGCASTSSVSVDKVTPLLLKVSPGWIADQHSDCKVWQPNPKEGQSISWSGRCQNQLAEGQGILIWYQDGEEQSRYEGILHGGKEEGKGILTWHDGSRYEGAFHNGKLQGQGIITLRDGTHYEQQYNNGKPVGQGMVTLTNGQQFTGTYHEN
jgi:hypothetical protein